jgi:DNA-directed RNA polymerase specialized sigma24 family protein
MSRIFTGDQVLIDRLGINDTDAFEELYRRYWYGLYRYCLKKLHSKEDARIIVRDIFIAIWEKRATLPVSFSLSKYLYEEVRNKVIKCLNQKLTDTNFDARVEQWLDTEFSVQSLQAARRPVKKEYTIIDRPSELIRQQTGQMGIEHNTIDSIKWMFQALTTKLSLNNLLSYTKN